MEARLRQRRVGCFRETRVGRDSNIGRPPPKGFPAEVLVRFDVQTVEEIGIQ